MNKLYFLAFLMPFIISLDLGFLVAILNLDKNDYRVHFISNISILIMKALGVISVIILIYFKVNLYISLVVLCLLILFNNIYFLSVYNNKTFNLKDLTISLPDNLKDIVILLNFKKLRRKNIELSCTIGDYKKKCVLSSSLISFTNKKRIAQILLLVINCNYKYRIFVDNIELNEAELASFVKKEL